MSDPINPPAPLDDLRERLDHIDRALLEALARRREVVEHVIRTKETKGDFVRDQDREEALLTERVSLGRELGLDGYFVTKIFQQVLDNSLRIQRDHLVAEQKPRRGARGNPNRVSGHGGRLQPRGGPQTLRFAPRARFLPGILDLPGVDGGRPGGRARLRHRAHREYHGRLHQRGVRSLGTVPGVGHW